MRQVTGEGFGHSNLLNTGFCAQKHITALGVSLRNTAGCGWTLCIREEGVGLGDPEKGGLPRVEGL